MDVLSWNVQGAFPPWTPVERIENQLRYLEKNAGCPDVITLNEVSRHRHDMWIDELNSIGYTDIVHTLDWAEQLGESEIPPHQDYSHVNGNLTAIHNDFVGENLTGVRVPRAVGRLQSSPIALPPRDSTTA